MHRREELIYYISREEYQTAKIINYMMAVTEVEKQASVYQHYSVLLHVELTDRCNCECMVTVQ